MPTMDPSISPPLENHTTMDVSISPPLENHAIMDISIEMRLLKGRQAIEAACCKVTFLSPMGKRK
jgi:hypothetical protein